MVNPHISFLIDLYNKTTTQKKEKSMSVLRKNIFNTDKLSETRLASEKRNLCELYLEITNNCNLSCIFCPRQKITRKKGYMDMDLYKHIIDDVIDSNINSINLHGFGEPLLHPDIIEMIKYAKERGVKSVSFNTNGVLLTKDMSLKLIESGLDVIKISIDSVNPKIYKHMRVGADLDKVIKNVVYLVHLKNKLNKLKFIIGIQFMTTKLTFDEEIINFTLNKFGTSINLISYGLLGLRSNSIEGLNELQLAVSPEHRKKPCEIIGNGYAVYWNGDVTVCCGDFNGEFIFGNIKESTLKELSKNEKLLSFYDTHKNKQFNKIPFCNVCDSDCFPSIVLNMDKKQIYMTL